MQHVEQPRSLVDPQDTDHGTIESRAAISEAYSEAWTLYQDLMRTGWEKDNALRASLCTLTSLLCSVINRGSEQAADDE